MKSTTEGFNIIRDRLFDLQNVAAKMNNNPITPQHFKSKTTSESDTREKALKDKLTMTCPDGTQGFFTWYSRYTPGAGRIHFLAEPAKNVITVGYIGEKIN